jgi:hypothetical protein
MATELVIWNMVIDMWNSLTSQKGDELGFGCTGSFRQLSWKWCYLWLLSDATVSFLWTFVIIVQLFHWNYWFRFVLAQQSIAVNCCWPRQPFLLSDPVGNLYQILVRSKVICVRKWGLLLDEGRGWSFWVGSSGSGKLLLALASS